MAIGTSVISARTLARLLPRAPDDIPRYRWLSQAIAALLLDGRLATGARLPSERELSQELAISRTTATAAYDALTEDGLLQRRRGSGSYLTIPAAAQVTGPGARLARGGARSVTNLSIASLPALPGVVDGALADALPTLAAHTLSDGYHPYGVPVLRELVAQRYVSRGVDTSPEQILITSGAQHGFVLVLQAFAEPGDRVLTELPTYPGALEAIDAHHCRPVGTPLDFTAGSWDMAAMRSTLRHSAARLAYLMPDFQNPTGFLVPTTDRQAAVRAARSSRTRIVVDESLSDIDLRTPPKAGAATRPAPMAALDSSVISLGSLSKSIWGGLRVGWVRADTETIQRLAVVRARTDMAGPVLDQLVAATILPRLDDLLLQRRAELAAQRDLLVAELAARLPEWKLVPPAGGLSAWVELDRPAATALCHELDRRSILLSPGSRFAPDQTLERFVRIPFALRPADLSPALATIADTWQQLGHGAGLGDARAALVIV